MGQSKLSVVLMVVCAVQCLAMTYDELEDFAEHLKKTSQLSPTLKKGVDPDIDYDEDEVVSDHAWEESGKFEGDLILNERQRRLIVEEVAEGLARNGIVDGTKRWPNNEVIYYIQLEHFSSDQVQAIVSGIEDLGRASCIKFRPYKKGDRDAVVIQGNRRGCFSQVGYQGGYQVLNLSGRHPVGRGCFRHGTVVHELLHTLGFFHMQSSPDRDDYVNIVWANIVQPARHNFRKYNSFSVSDFGVGYDYDSVLHYSRKAFSSNGQDTIVPKQSGAQIGQRLGLSDKDTQKLNKMYCDSDWDNGQADESPPINTGTKKKKGKNKPFQGQGIGYHQGKAVAIKLPAAETYKLADVPSFHVFDYFSKEPQILSTSENEGFRIGKEIAYSYNPPEPLMTQEYKPQNDFNAESDLSEMKFHDNIEEVKLVNMENEKHLSDSKPAVNISQDGYVSSADVDDEDPDLIDAFDRLSKIIKSHVYPSQTPDLSIYKANEDYTSHYNTRGTRSKSEKLGTSMPDKSEGNKMNSAMKFINNLYDFSSDKYLLEKPHEATREKYEHEMKDEIKDDFESAGPNSNDKKHTSFSFPLSKHYGEEYVSMPGFGPIEDYLDKNEQKNDHPSKNIFDGEKSNKNQDDRYPFHRAHEYHSFPDHDYTKDFSKRPEYNYGENMYSSSVPMRTQDFSVFRDPNEKIKNWYKLKDGSKDNT